ncbi:MAG: alkaline phosphatase family protein [Gemmatimonadetes bacterium]|nr:alkaline phosphatase family protein [Gemmatimonadota bacterium]
MITRSSVVRALLSACLLFTATVASAQRRPRAAAAPSVPAVPPRPTLVVFLTVDQFGSDYLERYGGNLTGGLARLRDEGATWMRGRQDHAIAETAPGHASTMSGRFPVHTGISSNSQGVNTTDAPLIGSGDIGASPFRFRGTTLYDWMKATDPQTRVLSVSRKDRGAILPIGRAKVDIYWFASNGRFTTSRYYRDTLPTWVGAFNATRTPQSYAGRTWSPLLPADRYAEPDTNPLESLGTDLTFPHTLPADEALAMRSFSQYPWMDSLTLAFALEGVRTMGLGATPTRTDLLAVSLSTTDAVGHRYGPDSREIHDQILRLDRYLGAFLDSLQALRGAGRIIVALTADHGIAPFPEWRSPWYRNHDAQRVDPKRAWARVYAAMRAAGVDTAAVDSDDGFRVRDAEAFRRAGVDPDAMAAIWVRELRRYNGVLRADLLRDLASADTVHDDIARRWLHMLPPDGPVRAVVTLEPFGYWAGVDYATHGQPHDYDTNVPVIFWGPGIARGRRAGEARVVDMAPTLATLLGITPLERLDGRALPLRP